jgi:hypothetical protein
LGQTSTHLDNLVGTKERGWQELERKQYEKLKYCGETSLAKNDEQLLSITGVGMVQGVDPSIRLPPVVSMEKYRLYTGTSVYTSVPVVSPLYVRLKTAMRQIQHRASTDSCKLDGNIA